MKQEEDKFTGLPENAFRELKAGEVYNPLMSPSKNYPEVNFWSVTWGIAMAILFSAAAAYLGLKVGQVFEAAIPIAIIAVGVSGAAKRKNALGENVIIQSIGACSGVIVAGAIFTLPALYILQVKYPEMTVSFMLNGLQSKQKKRRIERFSFTLCLFFLTSRLSGSYRLRYRGVPFRFLRWYAG